MSRNQFTLNPTTCDPMAVLGAATTIPGQSARSLIPFQVGGCAALALQAEALPAPQGRHQEEGHPARS